MTSKSALEKQVAELQKRIDELKGGQIAAKGRAIGLADIEAWNGIHGIALSHDGQWFAHRVGPANGNDELIVRQTKGDKEYRFNVGKSGGGITLTFSHDAKWLAYTSNTSAKTGAANKAEGKAEGGTTAPQSGGKKTVLLQTGNRRED